MDEAITAERFEGNSFKLCSGLENVIKSYSESRDPEKKHIYQLTTKEKNN